MQKRLDLCLNFTVRKNYGSHKHRYPRLKQLINVLPRSFERHSIFCGCLFVVVYHKTFHKLNGTFSDYIGHAVQCMYNILNP